MSDNIAYNDRTRKAAKEFRDAIAEEMIVREGITDISRKKDIRIDVQRQVEECDKRIRNLPYANLEEQAAVLAMLSEHVFMQVMKSREGEDNTEEINWLVDELQDGVQKLSETVDRIIKYEQYRRAQGDDLSPREQDNHFTGVSKVIKNAQTTGETN